MSTTLTDEQRLLRETVTELAGDHRADPELISEQRSRSESWELASELGLITMRWPEDAGGIAASVQDVVLVAEAFGRAPAVVPFAGPVLAAELLLRADIPADLKGLVGDLGPFTIGIDPHSLQLASAPGLAWDAAGASGVLELEAHQIVVRRPGPEAPSADITRVAATVDGTSAVRSLPAPSSDALARWQAFALTVLSADLIGVMAGSIDLAVTYANDRQQFGKPIGSFQALAHLLADVHVQLEAARSAVRHAASAVDQGPADEALLSARVAKAYASRVALGVTEAGIQIHGGIGTTWESLCHVFVRRALTGAALLGDENHQLRQIADVRLGNA